MQETNQLLLNYYKKEEMKKVRQMAEEQASLQEIFENVNMERISKQDIINMLGEDYEELRIESLGISEEEMNEENPIYSYSNEKQKQNIDNSLNVAKNTPMEIAKQYKSYFEEYRKDRKLICKSKKISNGTFQIYLTKDENENEEITQKIGEMRIQNSNVTIFVAGTNNMISVLSEIINYEKNKML